MRKLVVPGPRLRVEADTAGPQSSLCLTEESDQCMTPALLNGMGGHRASAGDHRFRVS